MTPAEIENLIARLLDHYKKGWLELRLYKEAADALSELEKNLAIANARNQEEIEADRAMTTALTLAAQPDLEAVIEAAEQVVQAWQEPNFSPRLVSRLDWALSRYRSQFTKAAAQIQDTSKPEREPASAAPLPELLIRAVGGQCAKCGFRYWEYQGHIIPCPRCENTRLRSELEAALKALRDAQSFVNIEQHKAIIALARQPKQRLTGAERRATTYVRLLDTPLSSPSPTSGKDRG